MVRLKVLDPGATSESGSGFQFLMVRLKDAPSFPRMLLIIFQFLMVRLKVRHKGVFIGKNTHFNSLWFD